LQDTAKVTKKMNIDTQVGKMNAVYLTRRILKFVLPLVALSLGAVVVPPQQAMAAGCTDISETPSESLTRPAATVTIPAEINRSLCGFYDGDYIAFTGTPGTTYHLEILNFEAPTDLQLSVYKDDGAGNYMLVTSVAGVTGLDLPVNSEGRYTINVTSGRSLLGLYGGGDYTFKLTPVSVPPIEPPAPRPTPTL
jgi:hypothetical protein